MEHRVQARVKGALIWVPALIILVWILGTIMCFLAEGGSALLSWEALRPWERGYLFLNCMLLIPLGISLRNSWRTGSGDYWFLTIVFVGYLGWNITELFWTALELPSYHILHRLLALFGELGSLYLVLHFLRLGWKETPRWILVPILVLFGYHLVPLFIEPFARGFDGTTVRPNRVSQLLWTLLCKPELPEPGTKVCLVRLLSQVWPALTEFPRSLFALVFFAASFSSVFYLFGLYTYRTLRPASPTPRTQTVIHLWTLFILMRFIEVVLLAVRTFLSSFVVGGALGDIWPWIDPLHELINQLLRVVAILLIVSVAVRYPESMLITHTQLLRATKLYQLFQVSQEPATDLRQDQLLTYIRSFPPELLAELQRV